MITLLLVDREGAWGRTLAGPLRGEGFVAALSNGACADVNNIDVIGRARPKNDRYQHAERAGAQVAAATCSHFAS